MTEEVDVSKYRQLSEVEHVLQRSGTYVGSIINTEQLNWVVGPDGKFLEETINYNPGLLKLFDEVITNCVDEHIRSGKVTEIRVNFHPFTGEIVVKDNGGIPVKLHPEYGKFVPELIFGELRTGSNFDDSERFTGGMNGLGSKLVTIFSKEFTVQTCDGSKEFTQIYRDNLSYKSLPTIATSNIPGTTIKFIPDYERLKCELDEGNMARLVKRVYTVAGCNPKIKVYLDDKLIKLNKFGDLVGMFSEDFVSDVPGDWEVSVAASQDDSFRQVSFVNGVDTFNGGSHIDYVAQQLIAKIREFIKKKHKVEVKPNVIKQQMFIFINAKINAPMFNSQTKEFMVTDIKDYGTSYTPSPKFIKQLLESPVIQKVLDWAAGERRKQDLAELAKANKVTQTGNFLKRIEKFEDATEKDRMKCSVYFSEGDAAAKALLSSRNPRTQAVMALKGKPVNVREVEIKSLLTTKKGEPTEFANFMAIMGLKVGQKVEKIEHLRYNKIVIAADNDPDGEHITGLLINLVNEFWPEVLAMGAMYRLNTPLIVAKVKKERFEFFNKADYDEWAKTAPTHKHDYMKGLGSFNTEDFQEFMKNESKYLKQIVIEDEDDIDALNMAFDKARADDRKVWLETI